MSGKRIIRVGWRQALARKPVWFWYWETAYLHKKSRFVTVCMLELILFNPETEAWIWGHIR
jgi:hypothetical protein